MLECRTRIAYNRTYTWAENRADATLLRPHEH